MLDACGVGALPDAADYGDEGADTLGHLAEAVGGLDLPVLDAARPRQHRADRRRRARRGAPVVHGRLHPLGPGKDSTTGHWELMGAVPPAALPTYPDGFPADVVAAAARRPPAARFCCNRPYNGIDVIEDFGEHHLRTGELILYTSVDSVLQIAAPRRGRRARRAARAVRARCAR